jgi:putative SOS response-associated peptidase YedK
LVPGEREQSVEIMFTPQTGQDLFIACLWTRVDADDGDPAFYTFAIVTDDPSPEIAIADRDRCIIPIRTENIDAWRNPDPANLPAQIGVLDDRERPYYDHQLAQQST